MAGSPLDTLSSAAVREAGEVESPLLPNDSMEDTGPRSTRKRPRLDSGTGIVDPITMLSRDAANEDDDQTHSIGSNTIAGSCTASPEPQAPQRPSSRVTINVKSPTMPNTHTLASGNHQGIKPQATDGSYARSNTSPRAQSRSSPRLIAGNTTDALAVSSPSPTQSVQIEVAEVEDMDQDPSKSNWKTLEEALQAPSIPGQVIQPGQQFIPIEPFPRIQGQLYMRETINDIRSMLERGHLHDAPIFSVLKQWLDQCVINSEKMTYEMFLEDRDFWEEIPMVIEALIRREVELLPDNGDNPWQCMQSFCVSFAKIALHFIQLDITILRSYKNDSNCTLDLVSKTYWNTLSWILQLERTPFFKSMEKEYGPDITCLLARILDSICQTNIFEYVSEFATLILEALSQWPTLALHFAHALLVIHNLVESGYEMRKTRPNSEIQIGPTAFVNTIDQIYNFIRTIDLKYQSLIAKKAAWISGDISDMVLCSISSIYANICAFDPQLGIQIAQDLQIEYPNATPPQDYSQIIRFGWKFKILKRYITDGRMELRVVGVDTMQQELVTLWKTSMSGNPSSIDYPITKFLLRFLRSNKIVEYLVGVDSHPQLIARSGNIVGFLVVTNTYTNQDTDIIWKTVTESHDPHTISEVLSMLTHTFTMHTQKSAYLYIFEKLIKLPLTQFDTQMMEFCEQLLSSFRARYGNRGQNETSMSIVPLRLCVHLIQEITSVQASSELKSQLQRFASRHLHLLIDHGISNSDKMELFSLCMNDISEMNELAVGSINALVALIPSFDTKDIHQLALEFNFTHSVVAELAHTLHSKTPASPHNLTPRIQLLLQIIERIPETITAELADKLWESLLSSKAIGDQNQSFVWDNMSRCVSKCEKPNPFLEQCMNEYLPLILPENFTADILSFAEQTVSYDIRFTDPKLIKEGEIIRVPGMDRIWHIILTVPSAQIGIQAINFAIEIYLDHPLIQRAPKSAAEATHVSLVDCCIDQLKAAANRDQVPTSQRVDETTSKALADELKFSRSLLFLRQLLHGLRTRPQYTPPHGSPPILPLRSEEIKGNMIDIPYQAFSGSSQTQIRTVQTGDLTTLVELSQKLSRLTGFSKFTIITGGRFLDLASNGNRTLRELRVPTSGLLIIRKSADSLDISFGGRRQSLTLVDSEVLKHFNDLYDLLSLDERLSKDIFDFLIIFPPQQRARETVRSSDVSEADMFPLKTPYKLLYLINSLLVCIREEALEANPDQDFINRSICNLVTFLLRSEMRDALDNGHLKLTLACNFVECLLAALAVKSTADSSIPFFSDPSGLVDCITKFALPGDLTSPCATDSTVPQLISNSVAVLLEASMHDRRVWDAFRDSARMEDIILSLLLQDPRLTLRQSIAGIIFTLCGMSTSQKQALKVYSKDSRISHKLETTTGTEVIRTLWNCLNSLIPRITEFPQSSQQFFEVSLVVFQTIGTLSPGTLPFEDYLRQWGEVLLCHQSHEFVGREVVDCIVLGIARLLKKCLEFSPSKTVGNTSLMEQLFNTYLFPNLSENVDGTPINPVIPVMHTGTRQEIYSVLLLLCDDVDSCGQMLKMVEDVIPPDYTHEPNWIFDRYKTIRSPEGYAGLKNLSNTCYFNSLFTQLFMNVDFRKFMLQVPVTGPTSSQRLLVETKRLFSYMQNTWQKSVDPYATVAAIRTFENEAIDINVQMDVDEFYNLIFDRWESQIQSPEDKQTFRSFYGGQLVQQIKSKECEHISERLEPFSAIQCDIKGKSGLEDSLRAYVEGEMMQGDNKYSCTSCNRHVDAVKRACLKDIPDNLIFHLKRFDFDVISMMRSKINDEFHFPERIDMAPFKVESLSDNSTPVKADVFELVGVLVHSGTAESGHYYSYIKERPSPNKFSSWVEFNDADVSRFDPSKIPDQCFGGMNDTYHSPNVGQVRFGKVWNAYMLFYQRVTRIETGLLEYQPALADAPVSIPLPLEIGNFIAMENELFLRIYCLLDPFYFRFILGLVQISRKLTLSTRPLKTIQKAMVYTALDTIDQLVSRTKDAPMLEPLFCELDLAHEENPHVAFLVLEWTANRRPALRNLLLKCPNPIVRSGFSTLVITSLACLKDRLADASLEPIRAARYTQQYTVVLENVLTNLHQLWGTIHLYSRAWDEYFQLVISIAKFGELEVESVLEHGFLLKCLEIIWLDKEDSKDLKCLYVNYHRLVEKGRKFSQVKLLELLYLLVSCLNWRLSPTSEQQSRICREGKFSMTIDEADLILPIGRHKELVVLQKIIEQQSNPPVIRQLIKLLVELPPSQRLLENICRAIEEGLNAEPSSFTVPFLEAAMIFCEYAPDADSILGLIDFAIKGIETLDDAGREYLAFLQALLSLQNEKIGHEEGWFCGVVLDRTSEWAPALLMYEDRCTSNNTFELLQRLLFSKEVEELPDSHRQYYRNIGRDLAQACAEKLRILCVERPSPQQNIDSRLVEAINHVLNHCMDTYFNENDSNEDLEFLQQGTAILSVVEQMSVEIPEDFVSDAWEDNSMMGSDSDIGSIKDTGVILEIDL
ncbi:hypothetical protein LOZ51_002594 [Ophidiomyces ophidiicola]|nr:hypothetical protein LOZ51_002594 [Ophidiomyces ophidiicola]